MVAFVIIVSTTLLCLLAGYVIYTLGGRIDGCGPYHHLTSVVDLDGDCDLDMVLSNLRHETDTIIWAGATFWINQGSGNFSQRNPSLGGPSTVAGDLDSDGDSDFAKLEAFKIILHRNQGGMQDSDPGDFNPKSSIS
jgi:hypothetical protein